MSMIGKTVFVLLSQACWFWGYPRMPVRRPNSREGNKADNRNNKRLSPSLERWLQLETEAVRSVWK